MAKNHKKRSKKEYVKVSKLDLDLLLAQNQRLQIQNSELQMVLLKSRRARLNTLHNLNSSEAAGAENG